MDDPNKLDQTINDINSPKPEAAKPATEKAPKVKEKMTFKKLIKKWWFWLIVGTIVLSIIGGIIMAVGTKKYQEGRLNGTVEPRVSISLNSKDSDPDGKMTYTSSVYIQNNLVDDTFTIENFTYSHTKIGIENDYVYYKVVMKFDLSFELYINGDVYRDSSIIFYPIATLTSSDNPNWENASCAYTVSAGSTIHETMSVDRVCTGKMKSLEDYTYKLQLGL